MKKCLPFAKSKDSSKVSPYVQSQADSFDSYTDYLSCTTLLKGDSCEPVTFIVAWMVLHWKNTHAIMSKSRRFKLTNAWKIKPENYLCLQVEQLLGQVSNSLGNIK